MVICRVFAIHRGKWCVASVLGNDHRRIFIEGYRDTYKILETSWNHQSWHVLTVAQAPLGGLAWTGDHSDHSPFWPETFKKFWRDCACAILILKGLPKLKRCKGCRGSTLMTLTQLNFRGTLSMHVALWTTFGLNGHFLTRPDNYQVMSSNINFNPARERKKKSGKIFTIHQQLHPLKSNRHQPPVPPLLVCISTRLRTNPVARSIAPINSFLAAWYGDQQQKEADQSNLRKPIGHHGTIDSIEELQLAKKIWHPPIWQITIP